MVAISNENLVCCDMFAKAMCKKPLSYSGGKPLIDSLWCGPQ